MKAYLVNFSATTRIVVEDDTNPLDDALLFQRVCDAAREQMIDNGIGSYLDADNATINEDTECPAGTFAFDESKAI
jgi:hypothetical protein